MSSAIASPAKETKLVPLTEAIRDHLPDGATVFIGGFGHAVPFAAAHEFIRQGKRELTLCRSGTDILFDQAIAGGCANDLDGGFGMQMFAHLAKAKGVHSKAHIGKTVEYVRKGRRNNFD